MNFEQQIKQWTENEQVPFDLKNELLDKSKDEKWVEDAFSHDLEFGTAGMRGLLEPGLNRMNIFTVGKVTEALALFIDTLGAETKNRGVVICFDPRYQSSEFAQRAAQILGNHGIKVYLFDGLRPTPELSFSIRHLNAYAGIMITASHNPKQYNGYKIYGPDGGQMPPKEVDEVVAYTKELDDVFAIKVGNLSELREANTIQMVGEDLDQDYLKALETVNLDKDLIKQEGDDLAIIYSPLHGTGKVLYQRVFEENGFNNVHVVASQAILDPEFKSVPFPNPEFAEAFDEGIIEAKKYNANLIIATDPDADRMGCAVLTDTGDYELLTGNQMAALMTNYLLTSLKNRGLLDAKLEVVKSIVSSELPFAIAKDFGIRTKDVLTGFKYIGEEIEHLNQTGEGKFIFGFEESYGYLFKDFVRDKDAMQASLMMAELAAYYQSRKMTVAQGLTEIFDKYGYYIEETKSIEMAGLDGVAKMQKMMKSVRADQITAVGDMKVAKIEDYLNQTVVENGETSTLEGYPKADVLKYYLTDGTWIALRPSGTEPKVKVYDGVSAKSREAAQALSDKYQTEFGKLLQV